MVDAESVVSRLKRLDALLQQLEEVRGEGEDAYRADARTRLAAARALQLSIQSCIDVGAHLISELGLDPPSDYRGVFSSLRSAGLDSALADRLGSAAGMRNVLVHGYVELDEHLVWKALAGLDDLRAFAAWALDLSKGNEMNAR